jgi:hypothetical protein
MPSKYLGNYLDKEKLSGSMNIKNYMILYIFTGIYASVKDD